MKVNCKVCGSEFTPNYPSTKICSEACRKVQRKVSRDKWRTKTPEHKTLWSGYSKAYRERNPHKAKLTALRIRAEKLGLPFDLDEQWLEENCPAVCPVLGLPLDGKSRDTTLSFDRLVPEQGYTKDNCVPMSMKANRLKSNASLEDLERIVAFLKEKLDKT